VKRAASLRHRKFREREGAFLVEGADLVTAGLAAGRRPQVVFVREERAEELARALGVTADAGEAQVAVYPVDERVAGRLSTLETPTDALAVFPLPERPSLAWLRERAAAGLVVYADGIADPGNMGTLLRAAVAFGATALATAPGSADVYGPKTVRGSMGAVFGLPLLPDVALGDLVRELGLARVYGLAAHEGLPLAQADLRRPAAVVVGAERPGLSAEARAHVTQLVTIPLTPASPGVVESLNAGVAGALALYEFSRRSAGTPDDRPRPVAPAKG
jgi:RNA methyltransferase, TrmH family